MNLIVSTLLEGSRFIDGPEMTDAERIALVSGTLQGLRTKLTKSRYAILLEKLKQVNAILEEANIEPEYFKSCVSEIFNGYNLAITFIYWPNRRSDFEGGKYWDHIQREHPELYCAHVSLSSRDGFLHVNGCYPLEAEDRKKLETVLAKINSVLRSRMETFDPFDL